ncbi:MAG: hypothetical protein MUF31_13040 [Akkermansiaceae bacterium]|nr:hypothetical protein [Akkermansiaceae bacterium]
MKVALLFLLTLLPALGIEGTVWYDSKGKVAWVDGPAADKTPETFVPEWRRREIERRERMNQPGGSRYQGPYSPWNSGYGNRWGWSIHPASFLPYRSWNPYPRPCVTRPGVSIIIRR